MTLALLLTAASGAWATVYNSGEVNSEDLKVGDIIYDASIYHPFKLAANRYKKQNTVQTVISNKFQNVDVGNTGTIMTDYKPFTADGKDGNAWVVIEKMSVPLQSGEAQVLLGGIIYDPNSIYPSTDAEKEGGALTEATFTMPASDVVLTPIYSEATLSRTVGETTTETAYESLKEALANVQDGDVIKLDWNVTVSEPLTTPSRGDNDPISFTLDLNGYILDAETTVEHVIRLNNGDELTISNIRDDKLGGIKGNVIATDNSHIIFDGGRYLFSQSSTAEAIQQGWNDAEQNYGWQIAEGKEFVNVNNGNPDDDDFLVRVDYAPFELTIGAGRFATFYTDENVTLAQGTDANVGLYTITKVNEERTTATATLLTGIVAKNTPMLVYNGTSDEQTVIIKVTTDDATTTNEQPIDEFKGTVKEREFTADDMAAATYYALSGGKSFAQVLKPGTIGANKGWLQFDNDDQQQGGSRSIMLVFEGDATAISAVSGSPADTGDIYDLQGRKVQKPARKGVYIKNGQKKVVR